jgi:ABC-2 type transport system permease protein
VVEDFYAITSVLTMLMTTAFVNLAAIRDFQHNTHQMLFSLPVRKSGYLWGRYWGSTLVAVIPVLGVSAGLLLLVGSGVANALTSDLKNEALASFIDPFGMRAFVYMTKYWTVAERNAHSLPLSGLLLWNRLLWLAAGFAVFGLVYNRIRLGEKASRKFKPIPAEPDETSTARALPGQRPSWRGPAALTQDLGSLRFELRGLIRTPTFIVVLAAALLNCLVSLMMNYGEAYGNKTFPVTYWMAQIIQSTLYLFLVALITYFAGQLVWRERDERTDEMQDSLPVRDWLLYLAKFTALVVAVFAIILIVIPASVAVQAWHGYTRFQLGLYADQLLWRDFSGMVFLCVPAFLFHVLSPNKYVGYFAFIGYLIADNFGWAAIDVATRMVSFGSRPDVSYSDFFGFAPATPGWQWFTLYWALVCGLLAVITILLYRRGKESAWLHRFAVARQRFRGGPRLVGVSCSVALVVTGGWVFYNTKVLNIIISPEESKRRAAEYEKKYKKLEGIPQPRVTAICYDIDLYPETRDVVMRGDQTIVNRGARAIDRVYLNVERNFDPQIAIDGASFESDDRRLLFRTYKLNPPMTPGETRRMRYTIRSNSRGFTNSVQRLGLAGNGAFFNNTIAPGSLIREWRAGNRRYFQ